jgi:nitrogen regulatory protein P-II 1
MRMILAVIQPTKLKAVQQALAKIGVEHMTVCDAQGYGRQRGQPATYRGNEYHVHLLRKVALEIVVNEDFVERTVATIREAARTGPEGNIGDGKIFLLPTEETVRLEDLVRGPEAVS